tara:strand:- start:294 stop:557 length:264 start_codon:yes stop_codon:yes gene_type:complete
MEFTPLKKKVLIASIEKSKTTESGIILEGSGVGDIETGSVLAIGSEVTLVAVGDEVIVDWAKCKSVTVNGDQRVVIDEEFIIAVLER